MSNDIQSLRASLFDALRGIKDGSLDVERAKAINETAQVIVNTAKVEIDYLRATGADGGTGFIRIEQPHKAVAHLPPERIAACKAADPYVAKKIG
jgi:hypothetical protein